ncbi:M14 family metallopeptidase [Neobacillus cucumis]|uniref:M14 family metallopeptidase n=1 Tax=Neobacillus cucumis TaxID=1740721 RepID=UPI002E212A6E|nr:M14 family zinc carboxypeptidase [Neobacillus cucumis]MED4228098.1 M14 family zinc carboxypeptidase [Neobacillus cucumis]
MEISVRPGDTFDYYSRLFKIPIRLIMDSNSNTIPTKIKPADKIHIPGYASVPYAVREGDTFEKIAVRSGIEIDALFLLNQSKDANHLMVSEKIFVPERVMVPFGTTETPLDYKRLVKFIKYLKRTYPFIEVSKIGSSVLGNSIDEIRIGKGEKKIHMNASFHANEWITTMVLMNLLNRYLLAITNGLLIRGKEPLALYEGVELSIVPMVNPDGVDLVLNGPPNHLRKDLIEINEGSEDFIHWKANIRGIDLNNQFPANWDICRKNKKPKSPAPRDFPGIEPLTEPEAVAIADLTEKNLFHLVLAFHTQGEEFYWGYEGLEPAESEVLAKELEKVSGYRAIRYVNSHAGYKDWFIQKYQKPGITLELGRGINPLPLSQFPSILKRAEEIFLTAITY